MSPPRYYVGLWCYNAKGKQEYYAQRDVTPERLAAAERAMADAIVGEVWSCGGAGCRCADCTSRRTRMAEAALAVLAGEDK